MCIRDRKIEAHLGDANLDELLTKPLHDTLKDDIELLDGAAYEFDKDKVDHGKLTPVFFGSALTNFGVEPFLADFLRLSMPPLPRVSDRGEIDPFSEDFSAFVFKIQANMNKAHRDRIAFMRICSGRFERGMDAVSYTHLDVYKRQVLYCCCTLRAYFRRRKNSTME